MHIVRYCRVGPAKFAATLALAVLFTVPFGAQAGELMDALSPEARQTVDQVVQDAVAYDRCRGEWEMEDHEVDSYVELLSETVKELPQYSALDPEGRKVLLLNLLVEMQQAAMATPAPDCAVVRIGGQRASLEVPAARS